LKEGLLPLSKKNRRQFSAQPPIDSAIQAQMQRGVALHQRGRLAEAERIYGEILQQMPSHFDALHLLGMIAYQARNYERAIQLISNAISINPKIASAYSNRGIALKELKRLEEALISYDKAIALKPDFGEAYYNRGIVLQEVKRLEEALVSYDKAIALKRDYAEAYSNRGIVLKELKLFEEALVSCDKAIALSPGLPEAHLNRGNALEELKRLDEALVSYDRAIATKRDYAEAYSNRGSALQKLKRFEEALVSYDKAIALKPDYAEAYYNRGNALHELKCLEEALISYDKAIELKPDHADAYYNKSWILLLLGQFESGWRYYEWRKLKTEPHGNRSYAKPLWDGGQEIADKNILVHHEANLGDSIQFCRFVKLLDKIGANVLFAPQKQLAKLMEALSATIKIVNVDDSSLVYDFHCPLMSLPLAFKTKLESLPGDIPYLTAQPDRVIRWREKIGGNGFKVGICWQGSSAIEGRAFPVAQFMSVSQLPNVRLISLQKGPGESQLADLTGGMRVETLGPEFDAGSNAFLDTAAVMNCCDLVITCDTSLAHLAGALAVPTWVALPHLPAYLWMLDTSDSPWYPTIRLFRQKTRDDWDGVFLEIEKALAEKLSANGAQIKV
jgi:tetratricopeptide (TPR) repeat protein